MSGVNPSIQSIGLWYKGWQGGGQYWGPTIHSGIFPRRGQHLSDSSSPTIGDRCRSYHMENHFGAMFVSTITSRVGPTVQTATSTAIFLQVKSSGYSFRYNDEPFRGHQEEGSRRNITSSSASSSSSSRVPSLLWNVGTASLGVAILVPCPGRDRPYDGSQQQQQQQQHCGNDDYR